MTLTSSLTNKENHIIENYRLQKTVTIKLNRDTHRCLGENESKITLASCISKFVQDFLRCNIPWSNAQNEKLVTCSRQTEYEKMNEVYEEISDRDEDGIYNLTGCLKTCKITDYVTKHINSETKLEATKTQKELMTGHGGVICL
jgi:hypothetical protein